MSSPNVVSQKPIFEKYDKNVQGNTVWERGKVAASVTVPFRDFPELSEKSSRTGLAVATGGNPSLARISARSAALNALMEATIKVSCVGGEPLAATDCLNFGNPEKSDQMGEFVEGIEGLRTACEVLDIPIVSGNVSLYNESSGRSIPPSALVTVFARVPDPKQVPMSFFPASEQTLFWVGPRSKNLGGSEFLRTCQKEDTRIPQLDFLEGKKWMKLLRQAAQKGILSAACPILRGGLLTAVATACIENHIGAEIKIPEEMQKDIPAFLFSESPGVILATSDPDHVSQLFGAQAFFLGKTISNFQLRIKNEDQEILSEDLTLYAEKWENTLREIF